jgi:hypothetical protein
MRKRRALVVLLLLIVITSCTGGDERTPWPKATGPSGSTVGTSSPRGASSIAVVSSVAFRADKAPVRPQRGHAVALSPSTVELLLIGSSSPPEARKASVRGHILRIEVAERSTSCLSVGRLYAVVVRLDAPVLRPNAYSSITTVAVTGARRTARYPLVQR